LTQNLVGNTFASWKNKLNFVGRNYSLYFLYKQEYSKKTTYN